MNKNPVQLADELLTLSEQYSKCSERLAELTRIEGEFYKDKRPDFKSDTAVERHFLTTEGGIEMTVTKLKLKSIEKHISTIKTYIEVAGNVARGIY